MTDRSFDRIAEAFWLTARTVLPDRVFEAAFEEVHRTHQRRVLVRLPWRFPTMNTYAKLGVAAVAVIAVGFLGLNFLGANGTGGGGAPSASPSPTVAPTPSPTVAPTPGPTAPPLTEQFTSETHGYSISYPDTWPPSLRPRHGRRGTSTLRARVATPSTSRRTRGTSGWPSLRNRSGTGRPRSGRPTSGSTWSTMTPRPHPARPKTQPVTIDGAAGVIGCGLALVTDGGRGYFVQSYVSGDVPSNAEIYDDAFFA